MTSNRNRFKKRIHIVKLKLWNDNNSSLLNDDINENIFRFNKYRKCIPQTGY